jgi:hypothetical protein
VGFGFLLLIVWAYGMPDFGVLDGKLATAIVVYADYLGCLLDHARRADREKTRLNDTARRSHRLRPRHLVDRHMGRDGTSTLAVAPRGHYCGGGDIGRCRVVNESPAIKPDIPMTSSANDLAASLSSRALTAGSPRWRSKEGRRPYRHWETRAAGVDSARELIRGRVGEMGIVSSLNSPWTSPTRR